MNSDSNLSPVRRCVGVSALLCAVAMVVCAVGLAGCEQPDWKNPDYIRQKLKTGDVTDRQLALDKLDELEPDQQKKVAPALAEVYMAEGPNQKAAMTFLARMRVPQATAAYEKELQSNATGYAAAAAEALGETQSKEALPVMISLYKSTDDIDLKKGLLRGFVHMPDPKMVGPLTATLKLNVDNYPTVLHSYACELLGDIGQASPEAIDKPARHAIVRALFLSNRAKQNVSKECGLAIQQIGAPMVGLLLKTFHGNNKEANQVLLKYNKSPDYAFPANRAKAVAAVRLSALKAKRALDPFLEDLDSTKQAPKRIKNKNHAVQWRVTEAQAVSEIIHGLGNIGNDTAAEMLAGIVKKEKIQDKWDEITDWKVELQFRQDAAFSLARIGDRSEADALLDMAANGVIIDLEKLSAQIEGKGELPALKRYQFNWMMAQAYTYLAGADGADKLAALAKKTKEPELKKKYASFVPALDKAGKCLTEGKPDAQATCLGALIDNDDQVVAKKAVYELGRLPDQVAGAVLAKHLGVDDLETREVLTSAAYRAPSGAMVDAINQTLEDEKDNSGAGAKLDRYRLKLLRAWLKNNVPALAEK